MSITDCYNHDSKMLQMQKSSIITECSVIVEGLEQIERS